MAFKLLKQCPFFSLFYYFFSFLNFILFFYRRLKEHRVHSFSYSASRMCNLRQKVYVYSHTHISLPVQDCGNPASNAG
uniref:Uncharacterized protein n=1 Tax=Anguilla anguilla TaxID=7936 RepID=A0A0E9WJM4_ANGAN